MEGPGGGRDGQQTIFSEPTVQRLLEPTAQGVDAHVAELNPGLDAHDDPGNFHEVDELACREQGGGELLLATRDGQDQVMLATV